MNEELSTALAALIEKTLAGIDTAAGFGAEQLPEVIRQLLAWNLAMNTICFIMASAVFYFVIMANIKAIKLKPKGEEKSNWLWYSESRGGDADGVLVVWFASAIFGWIPAAKAIASFLTSVKILIAPKVWLLEYAANLVK